MDQDWQAKVSASQAAFAERVAEHKREQVARLRRQVDRLERYRDSVYASPRAKKRLAARITELEIEIAKYTGD